MAIWHPSLANGQLEIAGLYDPIGVDCQAELNVYSSVQAYRLPERFGTLYEMAKHKSRIHYHGAVSQKALAAGMRACACLAYPCTHIESLWHRRP
jgi:hypothetical protein